MNIEEIRAVCLSFDHATEDIKWGHNLCFMIGGKMFCIVDAAGEFGASFQCAAENVAILTERSNIIPAPYLARNNWVKIMNASALSKSEWKEYLRQSYELVFQKLSKKVQQELGSK